MKFDPKFSFKLAVRDAKASATVHGTINEDFDLPVKDLAKAETLELDLSDVTRINSVGIRKFSQWLWEINTAAPNLNISMIRLPPIVVRQLNLIHQQFEKNIQVGSLFVPFVCDTCDIDDAKTLVTRDQVMASGAAFSMDGPVCATCGNVMELDIPDNYFAIVREH